MYTIASYSLGLLRVLIHLSVDHSGHIRRGSGEASRLPAPARRGQHAVATPAYEYSNTAVRTRALLHFTSTYSSSITAVLSYLVPVLFYTTYKVPTLVVETNMNDSPESVVFPSMSLVSHAGRLVIPPSSANHSTACSNTKFLYELATSRCLVAVLISRPHRLTPRTARYISGFWTIFRDKESLLGLAPRRAFNLLNTHCAYGLLRSSSSLMTERRPPTTLSILLCLMLG